MTCCRMRVIQQDRWAACIFICHFFAVELLAAFINPSVCLCDLRMGCMYAVLSEMTDVPLWTPTM
jgi:hypothetical protein